MVKNVFKKLGKKQKNNKGFSLVELIVVIAIMAVLVGVLAPQFIKYVEKSRVSTDMQNVQQMKSAVEAEVADNETAAATTVTIKIKDGTATSSIDLSSTSKVVKMKSSKWQEITFTLTPSSGTWEASGTTTNGDKDMKSVFE